MMRTLCQHTLIEFHGCDPARLKVGRKVERVFTEAVRSGGGTIVESVFHHFNPYGVSGVVVITESHVTIHTWPEHAYAAVDIFSCSEKLDHDAICLELKHALGAGRVTKKLFRRGPVVGPAVPCRPPRATIRSRRSVP